VLVVAYSGSGEPWDYSQPDFESDNCSMFPYSVNAQDYSLYGSRLLHNYSDAHFWGFAIPLCEIVSAEIITNDIVKPATKLMSLEEFNEQTVDECFDSASNVIRLRMSDDGYQVAG
jgi:hypothetical protein